MNWLNKYFSAVVRVAGINMPMRGILEVTGSGVTASDTTLDDGTPVTRLTLSGGGNPLTAATFAWTPPTAVTGESNDSVAIYADTPDATPTNVALFTHADETFADYVVNIAGRSADGQHFAVDLRASYESTAGSFTTPRAPGSSNALSGNPGAWSASFVRSGTSIGVTLVGDSASPVRWVVQASRLVVKKAATVAPFVYAALNWSVDYRGTDRTGAALIGTASTGTSGGHKLDSTAANSFAAGATMNSLATYANASDAGYSNPESWFLSDIVAVAKDAWTAVAVIRPNTGSTDGTHYYDNRRIFGAFGAYWAIALKDDGAGHLLVVAGQYDGAFKEVTEAVTANTPVIITARLRAGNLQIRANKGAWTTLGAVGPIDTVTDYLTNYSANGRADVDVGRLSVSPLGLDDTTCDAVATYLGGLYGIAV